MRTRTEAVAAAHHSTKGYKAISKQFEVHHTTVGKIIHKWKIFKTAASLPGNGHPSKFNPRTDRAVSRETAKSEI
uniref:Sleeping Beauty transposase HTH domain-containing protein n=1 Tax=Astatotilapia calliptera TaxID=8154 RepID=A0AAX7TN30_ASTCA